jgi:hypothetical protein
MRVSLTWIGVLLIAIFLGFVALYGYNEFSGDEAEGFSSWFTSYFSLSHDYRRGEGFQNSVPLEDDIQQVDTCPAKSNRYVDSTGQVMCCDGEVQNNQCRGKTICSLSEGTSLTPKCGVWFSAYLNEKGRGRCPPSMPNYFESLDGSKKGCCSGRRNKSGSGPLDNSQKKCTLYANQVDDERKTDSCTVQQMLENAKCFSKDYPNQSKFIQVPSWNPKSPAYVVCTAQNGMSQVYCGENKSWNNLIDRQIERGELNRNWRDTANIWEKVHFCSNAEKVHLLKTMNINDLAKTQTPR